MRDDATRKVILNSSVGGNASYEYHHDGTSGESLCHTYTFSVMASNAAGNGDISESLATTIPAGTARKHGALACIAGHIYKTHELLSNYCYKKMQDVYACIIKSAC